MGATPAVSTARGRYRGGRRVHGSASARSLFSISLYYAVLFAFLVMRRRVWQPHAAATMDMPSAENIFPIPRTESVLKDSHSKRIFQRIVTAIPGHACAKLSLRFSVRRR